MTNFTRFTKLCVSFGFTLLIAAACSSPKYYVFKTIKHSPYEKEAQAKAQVLQTESEKQTSIAVEDIAIEEIALVSTENASEGLDLDKISKKLAEKAAPAEGKKLSKLQEIKTAIQVKKEIKKIQKTLDEQAEMSPEGNMQDQPKSQLVALLLAILVGGLGIHRFYLGYTAIGIIQLLTLGGCGVWALIDLIRIAMNDLKPADGSPYDPTI
jgi:hypothetical protein